MRFTAVCACIVVYLECLSKGMGWEESNLPDEMFWVWFAIGAAYACAAIVIAMKGTG